MQICFAHDVFRSGCGAGDAGRSGRWLYDLLAPVLLEAGHSLHRFSEADPATARSVAEQRAAAGDASHATWAALLSDPRLLGHVAEACQPLRRFGLVIGYELTPNQMRFLSAAGTPFLDVSIDPIRFAPDLFLRMRTNGNAVLRGLQAHDQPAAALLPHVSQLQAEAARAASHSDPAPPSLLFAGQTDVDASLVSAGRLASAEAFIEDIRALLKPGWRLLLKPHPYGRMHQSIRTLRRVFPKSAITNDNIYALINAPFVGRVVTLSSGVAQEAALLGRPATALITPDNTREGVGRSLVSRDHRVGLDVLSPAFWRGIGVGAAVVRPPRPAVLNGALRRALGQSWGYVKTPQLSRRTLSAGQTVRFGGGGDGLAFCTFGWSQPEASGLWSDGPQALMLIDAGPRALDLVLECSAFVPAGHGPVQLEIRTAPGAAPSQRILFHNRRRRQVVIGLPAGTAEIVFDISGMTSPQQAGLSDDPRLIGLKVTRATAVRRGQVGIAPKPLAALPAWMGDGMRIAAGILATAIGLAG